MFIRGGRGCERYCYACSDQSNSFKLGADADRFDRSGKEYFYRSSTGSGKPEEIIEKMISGRINKFLKNSLLDQAFVKDPDVTIQTGK